eukprot:UN19209
MFTFVMIICCQSLMIFMVWFYHKPKYYWYNYAYDWESRNFNDYSKLYRKYGDRKLSGFCEFLFMNSVTPV